MRMKHPCASWVKPPGPVARGLRIGLLGGSFNPAHGGHFHVSVVALKRLGVDYVWWLVSPQNPLKVAADLAPLHDRLQLARRVAKHPRILVMDIEARFGTRYTIDTLCALQHRFPHVRFVWIMGTDNLETFPLWHRWKDVAERIPLAVVVRPGTTLAPLRAKAAQRFARARLKSDRRIVGAKPPALIVLDGARSSVSATALRKQSDRDVDLVRAIPA